MALIVVFRGSSTTHFLPPKGAVFIGRSSQCQIRIDHPSVSRIHAVLHLGPLLRVEDASSTGTWVRKRRLGKGEIVAVTTGELIELGEVVVFLREELRGAGPVPGALPIDPTADSSREVLANIADSDISVLLLGESGVGKSNLAQRLHKLSPRRGRPFVTVECAAITESLAESALFGHKKGAFSGAIEDKQGLLEQAHGGTLFLDEIGDVPAGLQVMLLRVLQEGRFRPVGDVKDREVDVRVIAATNRDLEHDVAAGRFRQDLFFRLSGISLRIPSLRDRPDLIVELAKKFLHEASQARPGREAGDAADEAITPEAVALLRDHPWPGNIRELSNCIQAAVVLRGRQGGPLMPHHLLMLSRPAATVASAAGRGPGPKRGASSGLDPQQVLDALISCNWNQTQAAVQLGQSRDALNKWLQRHGEALGIQRAERGDRSDGPGPPTRTDLRDVLDEPDS